MDIEGNGLNLYEYVGNNPINYINPSGYCKSKEDLDKVFPNKGYNPRPGERTFEGYVNGNVPRDIETKLYTNSKGVNTSSKNNGHFKRFGTELNQHGISGAHVHQRTRNGTLVME